jgi:tetratricopeptide (TPR) repeat protein
MAEKYHYKYFFSYAFNRIFSNYFMADPKEYWTSKAEDLKKDGKFEEAIKIMDKIQEIEKEEKQDDFWNKKAIQYCEIGEYEQAKDALYKDLERNSKSYDTLFLLGKILHQLKNYEESLECYNKASEEYSRKNLRNTMKIDQMKNVRKFEEAVKYSDMVHQTKQLNSEYWFHRGLVLFSLNKFGESSLCFENALEANQDNPLYQYELAKSELWAGNKEKTFEFLEKAVAEDPQIKEKLKLDDGFEQIKGEPQFRNIVDLSSSKL